MKNLFEKISTCRISGSINLVPILDLGTQALSGVFPESIDIDVPAGPLELLWCPDSGLVQLAHNYNPDEMYGDNYGYRSGLNQTMINHLSNKINNLERYADLKENDIVVDIGSNDATSLKSYKTTGITRIGIDPTAGKFINYYTSDIKLACDFFTENTYRKIQPTGQAKIVTSIAMFYDLPDPITFSQEIHNILSDDGIWHFEQSYLPAMLRTNSYDTVCHEHIEYYSMKAIHYIMEKSNLRILDFSMNSVNGGSIAVTACRKNSTRKSSHSVHWLLEWEDKMGFNTIEPYTSFQKRIEIQKASLIELIKSLKKDGKVIHGYGASTKGNVTLQYCGITSSDIDAIVEINPEKYNHYTPGTKIPIFSENNEGLNRPDYYLVLPWHFRDGILRSENQKAFSLNVKPAKFIFPFPDIEIV